MYIVFLDVTHQHSDKNGFHRVVAQFFSSRGSRPAPRQNNGNNGHLFTNNPAIRKAKSEWISKQLGRVNDGICGASGSKAAWTAIKTLKRGLGPSKRPPPARMKLPDGTFASSAEKNAEVFAQHFEKLYNSVESN